MKSVRVICFIASLFILASEVTWGLNSESSQTHPFSSAVKDGKSTISCEMTAVFSMK